MRMPRSSASSEEDDDPTGVRAILQAAPDPGPMPSEVMARIQATLAQEQARRALLAPTAPSTPPRPGAGQVIPLVGGSRSRRSPWRSLGGAAAAILLLAVGLGVLAPNLLRSLGAGDASTSAAGGAAVARDSTASAPLVVLRASRTTFTASGLVDHARRLSAESPPQQQGEAPGDTGSSPWGRDQVLECLDALGVRVSPQLTVLSDTGAYDGAPAAVLVVGTSAAPTRTAYLVRLPCSSASTSLVAARPLTP